MSIPPPPQHESITTNDLIIRTVLGLMVFVIVVYTLALFFGRAVVPPALIEGLTPYLLPLLISAIGAMTYSLNQRQQKKVEGLVSEVRDGLASRIAEGVNATNAHVAAVLAKTQAETADKLASEKLVTEAKVEAERILQEARAKAAHLELDRKVDQIADTQRKQTGPLAPGVDTPSPVADLAANTAQLAQATAATTENTAAVTQDTQTRLTVLETAAEPPHDPLPVIISKQIDAERRKTGGD